MDNQTINNDEISLKDIIITIKDYTTEVLKNWLIVGIITFAISIYFIYAHFTFIPKYNAETKFLVEGSSGSGGLGGLLGQFGLKGAGKFNPYKVTEVARSKVLLQKALFQKYDNDFIINHIISIYKLNEEWAKDDESLKSFKFKNNEFEKFDQKESLAFLRIYNLTIGNSDPNKNLLNFNYNDDAAIYKYNISTENEKLSLELINAVYQNLKYFFEEEIIKNQISTTIILKQKADSIQTLIKRKSYQLASFQDRTLGLEMSTPAAGKSILEKEIAALTMAYAEVMKSYEITDIGLKDTKPMFLKLDENFAPLECTGSNLIIQIIKGILIGILLSSVFLILRKIVREAMKA